MCSVVFFLMCSESKAAHSHGAQVNNRRGQYQPWPHRARTLYGRHTQMRSRRTQAQAKVENACKGQHRRWRQRKSGIP